jgi:hypothetical protein
VTLIIDHLTLSLYPHLTIYIRNKEPVAWNRRNLLYFSPFLHVSGIPNKPNYTLLNLWWVFLTKHVISRILAHFAAIAISVSQMNWLKYGPYFSPEEDTESGSLIKYGASPMDPFQYTLQPSFQVAGRKYQ